MKSNKEMIAHEFDYPIQGIYEADRDTPRYSSVRAEELVENFLNAKTPISARFSIFYNRLLLPRWIRRLRCRHRYTMGFLTHIGKEYCKFHICSKCGKTKKWY